MDNFDLNKNESGQTPDNGGNAFGENNNSMPQGGNTFNENFNSMPQGGNTFGGSNNSMPQGGNTFGGSNNSMPQGGNTFGENNNSMPQGGFQNVNSQPYNYSQPSGLTESFTPAPYAQGMNGVELTKKKKPIWLFVVIGVLSIALVLTICYAVIPSFKNSVKMLVLSDEDYYASVERDQAKLFSDSISTLLTSEKKAENKEISYEAEVSVTVGEYLTQMLELPKEYTVTAFTDVNMADGIENAYIELLVGDSKFVNANAWYDEETDDLYFNLPMYSDEVLCIKDCINYLCEYMEIDASELEDMQVGSVELTDEQVHGIVTRYSEIYLKYCTDVSIEKNVKMEASGLSAEYNMVVVNLTEDQEKEMLLEILETAQNDEDIIALVSQNGTTKSEYQDDIQDMIDTIKDSEAGEGSCEIRTYIDNNGIIVGRDFSIFDDEGKKTSLNFIAITDGNRFAFTISIIDEDSDETVSADIVGTLDKDGAFTGAVTFADDNKGDKTDFVIDIENFKLDKDEAKGKLSLEFDNDNYDGTSQTIKVTAELGKDGDYDTCNIEAYCDDVYAMSISTKFKEKDVSDISLPEEYLLDLSDENADISEYIKTIDVTELKASIKKEFGDLLSEEEMTYLMDGIDSALAEAGSGSFGLGAVDPVDPLPPSDPVDPVVPSDPPVGGPTVALGNIKFTINGDTIEQGKIFSDYKNIISCTEFAEDNINVSVESDDTGYIWSENYCIDVSVMNDDFEAKSAKDCIVYSVSVSEGAEEYGIDADINGIRLGDDESKVVEVLGTPDDYYDGEFSDTYTYGTFSDDLNYQIYIYEGKVYELKIYIY